MAPPDHDQAGLMLSVKAVERAAIDAATTGSRAAALHPLVDTASAAARIPDAANWPGRS